MKKYASVLALWALLGVVRAETDLIRRVDEYIQTFAAKGDFSGAVLIARDGQVVFQKAYGQANVELNVPNALDTRFLIASLTKTFTAAAVLRLRDFKKLRLEDPVVRHIPGFRKGITVRHLLSHSSGIPDFHQLDSFDQIRFETRSLQELVDLVKNQPLEFEPGSKHQYNNAGYVTLAYLVERVSGLPYEDFLGKEFFDPLGMRDTGVFDRVRIIERRASGYETGPPPAHLVNAEWFDASYAVGSGALYSTVGDLYKWGRAVRSKKIVDFYAEDWPWGWGRRTDEKSGLEWIEQTGLLPGFQSCLKVYTNRDALIIYLGNVITVAFSQFRKDLETLLFDFERPLFRLPEPVALPASSFARFLGRYRHPQQGFFRLVEASGSVYLHWEEHGIRRYLTPLGPAVLYERSEGTRLELKKSDSGGRGGLVFNSPWGSADCEAVP